VSVRPSVYRIIRPQQRRVAGLLLSVPPTGDQSISAGAGHPAVTAPQHGAAARRSAANAGTAMLTAKLFDEAELKADLYLYIFVYTSVN